MLSLQNICLNLLEDHQVLLQDLPWQLSKRDYYRHPILRIKTEGLCMGPHCSLSCQDPPPGWWLEYHIHKDMTIKYNGQYRFTLRQYVKHACCTDCDERCNDQLVTVENYSRENLTELCHRINVLIKGSVIKTNEEDPLHCRPLTSLSTERGSDEKIQSLIRESLKTIPHRLLD